MRVCVDRCGGHPSRAELRRRRITDAARKLFVINGFHATGMAQLARESGIAIGQIYRDFASKEDIVAALVETDCGRLMMYDQLESAIAADDAAAVRGWLLEFLDPGDDRDDARLFAEIIAESGRNPRIAAIFHTLHDQLREHIGRALAILAPGSANDARRDVMVEVLMTLSLGLFQHRLMVPDRDIAPVLGVVQAMAVNELLNLSRIGIDVDKADLIGS